MMDMGTGGGGRDRKGCRAQLIQIYPLEGPARRFFFPAQPLAGPLQISLPPSLVSTL